MIAEENISNNNPNISISNTSIILLIINLMKQTVPNFKNYLISAHYTKRNLNEDDLTQIYIEQANILVRKNDYPFNVGGQYRDLNNSSKGHSDIYFYPSESNVSTSSIFSVESKRLPSPSKYREKEYVIGDKNNGGIERYKTEKHGKGLNECGLLGFIENVDSTYWLGRINLWIENLAKIDKNWNNDEVLSEMETMTDYCILKSVVHRKNSVVSLTHLWVSLI